MVVAFVAMAVAGCTAVPAPVLNAGVNMAASEGAFYAGSMQATYAFPMEALVAATVDAGETLEYTVKRHSSSASSETYYLVPRRGDAIRVIVVRHTPIVTTIRVRVGLLGDLSLSRFVLGEIEKRLPRPTP